MYPVHSYDFHGLSSDVKPTTLPGTNGPVTVGSRFFEVDTGRTYDWNGTSWVTSVGIGLTNLSVVQGNLTNKSGSITLGGTSQTLAAANTSRRYLYVQNISNEILWVNFGIAAVQDQPSIKMTAGSVLAYEGTFVPVESVSIVGATTGSKFVAKEG